MSDDNRPPTGTIAWHDLTVGNAENFRDFYRDVVGWRPEPVSMGEYDDYNMVAPSTGDPAAGVCHARGSNADLPAVWLVYIIVDDLEAAMTKCESLGGQVIRRPAKPGPGTFCVIRDPAGAVCALYQG